MKKITAIFLMLAMLLPVCFSAVSCSTADRLNGLDEYDRAFALYEEAEKQTALDEKDSYTLDADISIKIDLGNEMSIKGEGKALAIFHSEGRKNISYTESVEMDITTYVGNVGQTVTQKTLEGYMDGKMFIANKPDRGIASIWSELSDEDYLAHKKQMEEYSVSQIPDITKEICDNATAKQNDDGTWTATFRGFNEQSVNKMNIFLFGLESFFAGKYVFCDLEITLNTNKDFVLTSMEIKPVFREDESKPENDTTKKPEISLKQAVKNINSTEKPAGIEFQDKNKVQDLRLAYDFERKLAEFKNADEGSFTVEISQETRYSNTTQAYRENDTVSFSRKDGDFKYEILSATEDNDITIKYEKGKKYILIETKQGIEVREKTEDSTDAAEVAFINSLLEYTPCSHIYVTDIADIDEDNDIIKLVIDDPDISKLGLNSVRSAFSEIRPYYNENGELEKYTYLLSVKYYAGNAGMVSLKISYVVKFPNSSAN